MTRHSGPRFGHLAAEANLRSVQWPAVLPHARGMNPPPQDAKKLYRECNRLAWAIRCKLTPRSKLAVVLDRYDQQLAALRRQHDIYSIALEAIDPVLFARAEAHMRDMDDPRKAIEWELRAGGTDDV